MKKRIEKKAENPPQAPLRGSSHCRCHYTLVLCCGGYGRCGNPGLLAEVVVAVTLSWLLLVVVVVVSIT
jgi:hypothetical protein